MPRGLEDTPQVQSTVENQPKPEEKKVEENVVKTSAAEVHWTVPEGTNKVYLYEYDESGKQVTSYTISNYISMKPKHTFIIVAK